LKTTLSFLKPPTDLLELPPTSSKTHLNSFHFCTLGGVYSVPPKVQPTHIVPEVELQPPETNKTHKPQR